MKGSPGAVPEECGLQIRIIIFSSLFLKMSTFSLVFFVYYCTLTLCTSTSLFLCSLMEGFGSGRSKKTTRQLKGTVSVMKGWRGAVPEECGFIHGGLSELQHNVLQRTERSLNEGDREEREGRGRRRFLINNKINHTFLSLIFARYWFVFKLKRSRQGCVEHAKKVTRHLVLRIRDVYPGSRSFSSQK